MQRLSILALLCAFGFISCSAPQTSQEETAAAAEETETYEQAEQPANRGTAELTLGDASVSIEYGRPELKGRDMKSQAEPGFVWRLGMNEATTIESNSDLIFGETTVPAGVHTIFARLVEPGRWELIFNSETGLWGAFEYDPERNVAQVPLTSETLEESVEQFTIELQSTGDKSGEILIKWGQDQLKTEFRVP